MATIIQAKNLDLWYGQNHALHGVNIEIPEHEITAFIGPSGCGKSTFLRTLNRMNDLIPSVRITGEVNFRGQNIYDSGVDPTWLRKQVGMVFQKANPFPMSIYDNVAYGPRTHGIRSKVRLDEIVENSLRAAAIWDEVKDRLKKSALGLSGGQQQRLCIARALAVEPEVLLMDESTSALDPISTSKIEDLAAELKTKYTVIMVTHNMQQAARISDNTAFFLLGDLVEFGKTEQIISPVGSAEEDGMRNTFNEQLERLHVELIQMGATCEDAISAAAEALLKHDQTLAATAVEAERELDRKEREVENLCLKLLLQQQPVARDLREISAALKMISDLERIGDQAADIAELTRFVQVPEGTGAPHIADMARAVIAMVTDSVDSFVKRDLDLARAVCKADDKVDALFQQVKEELIALISADAANGEQGLELMMVAKYLERIGDHATNVAEWVEYSITGVHPSNN